MTLALLAASLAASTAYAGSQSTPAPAFDTPSTVVGNKVNERLPTDVQKAPVTQTTPVSKAAFDSAGTIAGQRPNEPKAGPLPDLGTPTSPPQTRPAAFDTPGTVVGRKVSEPHAPNTMSNGGANDAFATRSGASPSSGGMSIESGGSTMQRGGPVSMNTRSPSAQSSSDALNMVFSRLDTNGDQALEHGELVHDRKLAAAAQSLDRDGNGKISRSEFSAYAL